MGKVQVIVDGKSRGYFSEAGVKIYLTQTTHKVIMSTATAICLQSSK